MKTPISEASESLRDRTKVRQGCKIKCVSYGNTTCALFAFEEKYANGIEQADGSIKSLTPRQVADLLGHSTSQITELYYVKKDTSRLNGMTDGFEM